MNEQELAGKIVQHLDASLGQIKQGTLYQLQSARAAALDRYRAAPEPVMGLAWAGDIAYRLGGNRYLNARNLLAVGLLLLSLIGISYWQFATQPGNQASDFADLDASLLAGELPIDAYLDSEFEAWLKRSSQ